MIFSKVRASLIHFSNLDQSLNGKCGTRASPRPSSAMVRFIRNLTDVFNLRPLSG
jgi:hypothetical protein